MFKVAFVAFVLAIAITTRDSFPNPDVADVTNPDVVFPSSEAPPAALDFDLPPAEADRADRAPTLLSVGRASVHKSTAAIMLAVFLMAIVSILAIFAGVARREARLKTQGEAQANELAQAAWTEAHRAWQDRMRVRSAMIDLCRDAYYAVRARHDACARVDRAHRAYDRATDAWYRAAAIRPRLSEFKA